MSLMNLAPATAAVEDSEMTAYDPYIVHPG